MVNYFGVNMCERTEGLKLSRKNYIKVNNNSSFINGKIYSDSFINKQINDSLFNIDLNMEYFHLLSKEEFNNELMLFINKTRLFVEIADLNPLNWACGYYIMVLDEYAQIHIGRSNNIKKRIQSHWSKQKEFDRLIFGNKLNSILSIDSFRAYDTKRIFVYPTNELEEHEDYFINQMNMKYLLNRTNGGTLNGLEEAITYRKTRNLSV